MMMAGSSASFQFDLSLGLRGHRFGVGTGNSNDGVWHVYILRRGRTAAVVEAANVSEDGRWIVLGTRKTDSSCVCHYPDLFCPISAPLLHYLSVIHPVTASRHDWLPWVLSFSFRV